MNNKLYLLLILILAGILVGFRNARAVDLPDYFICKYWQDTNNDGLLDADEFVGVKDTFDATDDSLITFVGYYYNQKGNEVALKIYDPDDNLYSEDSAVAEYGPTHVQRWWFTPSTMVENGGTGDWTANWYLSGNLEHTQTFTLTDWLGDFSSIFDEDSTQSEQRDFFACDSWVDKDGDGLMARDEYVGVKDTFYIEEDTVVTFISYWHNDSSKYVTIKLYDPNGNFWTSDSGAIELSEYIYRWPFYTRTMASEGGLGEWTVKYYLNGDYANSMTVYIDKEYSSTTLTPQFFLCNYWKDLNSDGYIESDMSEFIGIKNTFTVGQDTEITFMSHWVGKKGMLRKMVIYSPDGNAWETDTLTIKSDDSYWHPGYYVKSMYNEKGTGVWSVRWYLNDEFVTSKDFTIVKE